MAHRLPVVAFDAGAVADTVGDAGIVLTDKSPSLVAGAVHRVQEDALLRTRLVAAGLDRLTSFDLERTQARFVAVVQLVLDRLWARPPPGRVSDRPAS
jgi:glycosyltransferase involved in cell wall biosynthesis